MKWVHIALLLLCSIITYTSAEVLPPLRASSISLFTRSKHIQRVPLIVNKKLLDIRSGFNPLSSSHNEDEREESGSYDELAEEEEDDNIPDDEHELEDQQQNKGRGILFNKWKNSNIAHMVLDAWQKTPPITQSYLTSCVTVTLAMFFFNQNQWPSWLTFDLSSFLFKLQFWRIFTGFLFLGQLDVFFPLTIQFVWQHMTQLERLHYKQPEDFVMLLGFGMSTLILLYTVLGISMNFLGHNLATYLVYIWSRVFEGLDVNFMDMFSLKSEMLPWFFCAQTWLIEQQIPFADLIGILVGHLYWYLKQKKAIHAPGVLKTWFAKDHIKKLYAQFKEDLE